MSSATPKTDIHMRFIQVLITGITVLSSVVTFLWFRNDEALKTQVSNLDMKYEQALKQIHTLEQTILDMEREKIRAETRFLSFVANQDQSPLPMWLKDKDGKYLVVNSAYRKRFLAKQKVEVHQVLGHFDDDIWPASLAAEYRINDTHVLSTEEVLNVSQYAPTTGVPDRKIQVIKYPVYIYGLDAPYAVGTIAFIEDTNRR